MPAVQISKEASAVHAIRALLVMDKFALISMSVKSKMYAHKMPTASATTSQETLSATVLVALH